MVYDWAYESQVLLIRITDPMDFNNTIRVPCDFSQVLDSKDQEYTYLLCNNLALQTLELVSVNMYTTTVKRLTLGTVVDLDITPRAILSQDFLYVYVKNTESMCIIFLLTGQMVLLLKLMQKPCKSCTRIVSLQYCSLKQSKTLFCLNGVDSYFVSI